MSVYTIEESNSVIKNVCVYGLNESILRAKYPMSVSPDSLNDELTKGISSLAAASPGTGHDQFLSGIIVQFDLTFTIKAWTEFQRYHFTDFVSSQSTIHRISRFDLDQQYIEYVDPRIINIMKDKVIKYNNYISQESYDPEVACNLYLELLYSNPCGLKLTAGITTNYRQLKTMYSQRKNHKLNEWREFCQFLKKLPHSEFITGEFDNSMN